jgi:hypothetical protein
MKKNKWTAAVAAGIVWAVGVSHASTSTPSAKELTPAVKAFLADHGDLCLAWYTWPRELSGAEQQSGRNEAVQLPVLERLGVVQSEVLDAPAAAPAAPTKRYSLTPKGQQYYLKRERETLDTHGQSEEHAGDFCVAHLTLDRVVKWSPPEAVRDHLETVVRYTYQIKAVDWMSDAEAQRVFPVVDRIIRGAGTLEMTATVQQQDGKWVPVLPGQ